VQVFSTEGLPVGTGLLGGSVDVVPAMATDQIPGKAKRVYMMHLRQIMLPEGRGHLVVRD